MAASADGGDYWLVASDAGIFNYGTARFYGSTGSTRLNKPVVGMAAGPLMAVAAAAKSAAADTPAAKTPAAKGAALRHR